ncbi:hypothetical protein M758_6G191400 [Ceratodon purpureus]|nr:hypothetical protein M758_6G191400 [Ceratodon purpureus]
MSYVSFPLLLVLYVVHEGLCCWVSGCCSCKCVTLCDTWFCVCGFLCAFVVFSWAVRECGL